MAKTEYIFLGISHIPETAHQRIAGERNSPSLQLGVGKHQRLVSIPLSERDLLKVITDATTQLENLRKERERHDAVGT